ncbi:hypothetical protein B296_00043881 [Ensete ventricosum]|uniref:Uncharacterized protein n=1 Tax=Ensete ventricosum TaxID=4639 RepID=A0A426WY54_ENSVE|nr:hypothetical protein B296_00043881 [Ensete ventricosum]
MTTKHKFSTSRSFIHSRLNEVIGGRQSTRALSITPFTISGKGSYSHKHRSTKGHEQ